MTSTYKVNQKERKYVLSRTPTKELHKAPGTLYLNVRHTYKKINDTIRGESTVNNMKYEINGAIRDAYQHSLHIFKYRYNINYENKVTSEIKDYTIIYYKRTRTGQDKLTRNKIYQEIPEETKIKETQTTKQPTTKQTNKLTKRKYRRQTYKTRKNKKRNVKKITKKSQQHSNKKQKNKHKWHPLTHWNA